MRRIPMMVTGAALGAVLLGGCAPTDATRAAAGWPGSAGTAGPSATAPVAASPTPTPDAATRAPSSPAECLVGTWLADNESFLALMQGLGDEVQDVTGAVVLEFTSDGTMTTDYQDWRILAAAEGHEVTVHRHGLDTGTYTVTETTVSFADTAVGSTIVMTGEGLEMTVAPEPNSVVEATYTCEAGIAQVHAPEGDLRLLRR